MPLPNLLATVSFEPNLYQFPPEDHLTSSFYSMWPMGNSSSLSEIPRVRILQNLSGGVHTAGCVLASLKFQLTQKDLSIGYWLSDSIVSPSTGFFGIADTPSKCQSKEIPLYFVVSTYCLSTFKQAFIVSSDYSVWVTICFAVNDLMTHL